MPANRAIFFLLLTFSLILSTPVCFAVQKQQTSTIVYKLDEFMRAFRQQLDENEMATQERWSGQIISISSYVEEVVLEDNQPVVYLRSVHGVYQAQAKCRLIFDQTQRQRAKPLSRNDPVIITGIFSGYEKLSFLDRPETYDRIVLFNCEFGSGQTQVSSAVRQEKAIQDSAEPKLVDLLPNDLLNRIKQDPSLEKRYIDREIHIPETSVDFQYQTRTATCLVVGNGWNTYDALSYRLVFALSPEALDRLKTVRKEPLRVVGKVFGFNLHERLIILEDVRVKPIWNDRSSDPVAPIRVPSYGPLLPEFVKPMVSSSRPVLKGYRLDGISEEQYQLHSVGIKTMIDSKTGLSLSEAERKAIIEEGRRWGNYTVFFEPTEYEGYERVVLAPFNKKRGATKEKLPSRSSGGISIGIPVGSPGSGIGGIEINVGKNGKPVSVTPPTGLAGPQAPIGIQAAVGIWKIIKRKKS